MTWSQQRAWKPVAWAKKATGAPGVAGHSKTASSMPLACIRDSFTGRIRQVLSRQAQRGKGEGKARAHVCQLCNHFSSDTHHLVVKGSARALFEGVQR